MSIPNSNDTELQPSTEPLTSSPILEEATTTELSRLLDSNHLSHLLPILLGEGYTDIPKVECILKYPKNIVNSLMINMGISSEDSLTLFNIFSESSPSNNQAISTKTPINPPPSSKYEKMGEGETVESLENKLLAIEYAEEMGNGFASIVCRVMEADIREWRGEKITLEQMLRCIRVRREGRGRHNNTNHMNNYVVNSDSNNPPKTLQEEMNIIINNSREQITGDEYETGGQPTNQPNLTEETIISTYTDNMSKMPQTGEVLVNMNNNGSYPELIPMFDHPLGNTPDVSMLIQNPSDSLEGLLPTKIEEEN